MESVGPGSEGRGPRAPSWGGGHSQSRQAWGLHGSRGLAGDIGRQLLDRDGLSGVQQVVHIPQRLLARWRARICRLIPVCRGG